MKYYLERKNEKFRKYSKKTDNTWYNKGRVIKDNGG